MPSNETAGTATPKRPQDRKKKKPTRAQREAAIARDSLLQQQALPAFVPPVDADDEFAPTVWGANGVGIEKVMLPSGQKILIRRPGPERLMEAGVLREMDMLTSVVAQHISIVNGKQRVDPEALIETPQVQTEIMEVVDRVLIYCILKPAINHVPEDPSERDMTGKTIYSDQISIEDKMFAFGVVMGGTRSVERFREESLALVGGVDLEQAVEDSTEPDVLPGHDDS